MGREIGKRPMQHLESTAKSEPILNSLVVAPIECRATGGRTVVSANIAVGARDFSIYFDVPACPAPPAADAFLASTLLPAMKLGLPIVMADPVSAPLLENIQTIQSIFRAWRRDNYHSQHHDFHKIEVSARGTQPLQQPSSRGVAAFFSCGIDSFYTLLKHLNEINYLIYIHGFELPHDWTPTDSALTDNIATAVHSVAREYGKSVIEVKTNLRQMADHYISEQLFHGSFLAAVAYALNSQISKVYIPSTHDYSQLFPWGSHPLLDPLWATENIAFVHDGSEAQRLEKTAQIAGSSVALRHLRVCWQGEYNCGVCNKCVRTLLALQALGLFNQCSTFHRAPLTLDEVARIPMYSLEQSCYFQEIRDYLVDSSADVHLLRAVDYALRQTYYRGFRRIQRGDIVGRVLRRAQRTLRGLAHLRPIPDPDR